MLRRDNTDEAAQAADDHWSEYGSGGTLPEDSYEPQHVPVEIFGSNTCSYCEKAKALCDELKLPYVYKNIDDDFDAFDQLVGRIKQWKTVPQIFMGAKHIGGFDDLKKHLQPED